MITPQNPFQFTSSKIHSESSLVKEIVTLKKEGETVGLCVGAYDLMHPGHIKHFQTAKSLCDRLVVGVTRDDFVTRRKGEGRPVISEILRAYSIAELSSVDFVVISPYEKAVPLIESLKPSFYIKGAEYEHKRTPGITAEREAIRSVGGEMRYTMDEKLSTTDILGETSKKNRLPVCVIALGDSVEKSNVLRRFSTRNNYMYLADYPSSRETKSVVQVNLASGFDVVLDAYHLFMKEDVQDISLPVHSFMFYPNSNRERDYTGNYDIVFDPAGDVEVNAEAFKHQVMNYLAKVNK